jgi:DNA-binding CsgD family transcriptional regulator
MKKLNIVSFSQARLSMANQAAAYDNGTLANGYGQASGMYVTVQKGTAANIDVDFKIVTISTETYNKWKSAISEFFSQEQKKCWKKIMADLDVLETNLSSIFSTSNNHHEIISYLTDQEMRVAALIKRGLTSQKISNLLCISEETVKTHRKNIRKKLKINNTNTNLISYLKSNMPSDLTLDPHRQPNGFIPSS